MLQADLAPLALQLLRWGVNDPTELCWLDPPPRAAFAQACDWRVDEARFASLSEPLIQRMRGPIRNNFV